MSVGAKEAAGYIELKFGPCWKYIAVVRAFIQNFLALSFTNDARADKIAMAASELLENAVKYASGDETRVSVRSTAKGGSIIVTVQNEATPEAVAGLKAVWESALKGDPLSAYIAKMQEAATRNDSKSQLGLVRIRYETGAEMGLDIDGSTVSITLKYDSTGVEGENV